MHSEQLVENIDKLLLNALAKRASDIHFEPYQQSYRIRMRIDGVLQNMMMPSIELAKQIAARLKIMAKLNIAEQRLPQDGQLVINQYAMRISTLPVINGEKIVLRLMDNHEQKLAITELGLSATELALLKTAIHCPQGLILVTGPTGSGKTATLYSSLMELNQIERNICSAEDPIEVPIEGINQTQVNLKTGLTFSNILRSLLRQDPDVMMIGEIRDKETAEIAVQAAQTGHLVLSTLHTNSSVEALTRLNQIGIENYLLASCLKLIIAQRLVRKLCEHCKQQAKQAIKINGEKIKHFIATGCLHCAAGYYGRVGIYELLVITPEIQTQILSHAKITYSDFTTLKQNATRLIKQGITSYAEVLRVLGESHNGDSYYSGDKK